MKLTVALLLVQLEVVVHLGEHIKYYMLSKF